MKTIVSVQEISEFDIKPSAAIEEWRGLVREEIAVRWKNRSGWKKILCPICSIDNPTIAFEVFEFPYVECTRCGSLYAPSRPSEDELWSWYSNSRPAQFWREKLLPASEKARFEKIVSPREYWILDCIAEYFPSARRLIDISHNGRGVLDMIDVEDPKLLELTSAGMTADLEGKTTNRIKVQPTRIASLPGLGPVDVVVAIDIFDRSVDLSALVEALKNLLNRGGLLFATVPVSSGFEIQTLWEKSPTIIPPDKINLPSVFGLKQLFGEPDWEILELSTPGMFDVEMVYRAMRTDESVQWPRGIKALIHHLNAAERTSVVELLQSLSLTSFARIVIRKVGN
jgi:hypothetical protein